MKKINYLMNGLVAIALILTFTQCNGTANNTTTTANNTPEAAAPANLKIAYVEIDSLLTKYYFWQDLNEGMMKKEENIRATLNQKMRELEKDAKEFQRKIENNAFVSQERAQQENNRLVKKQQDLQSLQNRLSEDLSAENQKNNLMLRDSINAFLKDYNKSKQYSLILTNTGFDNLLYADQSFNITDEIVEGLNDRYRK